MSVTFGCIAAVALRDRMSRIWVESGPWGTARAVSWRVNQAFDFDQYCLTGGAERWLRIPLGRTARPSFAGQALMVVKRTPTAPFVGPTTGFVINYTPDHAVRYDESSLASEGPLASSKRYQPVSPLHNTNNTCFRVPVPRISCARC